MKKKFFISVIILFLLMLLGVSLFGKISIEEQNKDIGEIYSNEIANLENGKEENVTIVATKKDDATISNNIISTEPNKMIKQEGKAEIKTETKAETKTETKTEAKSETKAEMKTETKSETKVETKTEVKSETKAETKTEAKAETKDETKTETKPEKKTEAKTEQGNKQLANTTYRKVNTEVVPEVINILNDEIGKHEELKKYNTRAIKGTKQQVYENTTGFTYMFVKNVEKGKVSGNYIVFEQRIRNTVGAGGKYYVYAEDEYVYDSTGSKSYWTQTLVWYI